MSDLFEEPWTIQKVVGWTTSHFMGKGIPSARLDAELLLAHVLKCKRLDLYLKFDQPLKAEELAVFKQLVKRRASKEPVAYITGSQEFYGRNFVVGPGVLIPRPETEHLVDEALKWAKDLAVKGEIPFASLKILDVGAGSGCIGVTLAAELPQAQVTALDVSPDGVRFTKLNSEVLEVESQVHIHQLDFLDFNGAEVFDLIVSNPPYVGNAVIASLQEDVVRYEPHLALFGGELGHETLASWLPALSSKLKPKGLLLCELGFDQGSVARDLAQKSGFKEVEIIKDHSGHDRILKAIKDDARRAEGGDPVG